MKAYGDPADLLFSPARESGAERMEAAARHSDELLHFLRRRVGTHEDAADLRQEIFLRMDREPGHPVANMRAYAFQVARNIVADFQRARHRAARVETVVANENVACDAPSAERVVAGASELDALRCAIAALPDAQRQALLWYRLDGIGLKEIGERLGVSESMASRYVKKALRHCQQELDR